MGKPAFVTLTPETLDEHHICCALGDKKHEEGVALKKAWLKQRMKEGLVFRKLDERGKVFIEYMPSETAWRPVVAKNWLTVHCLWVSGKFAGHGYARQLVEHALADARQHKKHGLLVVCATKKRPFLSDPKFLAHLGFEELDRAGDVVLMGKRVIQGGAPPRLAPSVKGTATPSDGAFVATVTDQCPFNLHWGPEVIASLEARGHDAKLVRLTRRAQAQKVASPLGTYGLERGGELVCHHLTTDGATDKLLAKLG